MNAEALEAVVLETNAKVDEILRRLSPAPQKHPGMTFTAFAAKLGVDRSTVHRWYREGKIRKANGRIPYECLAKFLT